MIINFPSGFRSKAGHPLDPAAGSNGPSTPPSWVTWERGYTDPATISDELLLARVAESARWCDALATRQDLKSTALSPALFHDGPDDLVCALGTARYRQLGCRTLSVSYQSPVHARGRFMLYFPDQNLSDGYAEMVSDGFFDANNVPASDTCVSFFDEEGHPDRASRRRLLCYVPASALECADAGIEGNPEACIVWLDQCDASIRRRLEGFLRKT